MRRYFYPRSPCGERRGVPRRVSDFHTISIHALLAESDRMEPDQVPGYTISIHALLAESDAKELTALATAGHHFYPRSPCGERLRSMIRM